MAGAAGQSQSEFESHSGQKKKGACSEGNLGGMKELHNEEWTSMVSGQKENPTLHTTSVHGPCGN